MIRLWISRDTELSIQEQLSAQFVLGILSRRLAPEERLPSVRGLARRLSLHPNTVSAVYRDLADRGWVSTRQGSGVYVRRLAIPKENNSLDAFVRNCVDEGLARGFSLSDLRASFGKVTGESRAAEFLVIDPDPKLAHILAAEVSEASGRVIPFAGYGEVSAKLQPDVCLLVTQAFAARLPPTLKDARLRTIRLKSMQDVLVGRERPRSPVLIAVASHSESVLRWARTLLSALGFAEDSILLRNAQVTGWQEGLKKCEIVAADLVTASELPASVRPVIFKIVADDFLHEFAELFR